MRWWQSKAKALSQILGLRGPQQILTLTQRRRLRDGVRPLGAFYSILEHDDGCDHASAVVVITRSSRYKSSTVLNEAALN